MQFHFQDSVESRLVNPSVTSEGTVRPKERRDTGQTDLLRLRLGAIIAASFRSKDYVYEQRLSTNVRSDIYQRITDAIIRDLEQGTGSWIKPWTTSSTDGSTASPRWHALPWDQRSHS